MTLKLFVADDSVTIQKIVGLAFSCEDAVVQSVSSGDAALDEVRAFKPDVVLADVFMPGCNGYQVCELIKEDRELKNTPVILLVGTFEPFDESEASRVKCDGYLTKPFDTTELIQTVHRLTKREDMVPSSAISARSEAEVGPAQAEINGVVGSVAWASFLGSSRVLDLFDPEVISAAEKKNVPHFHPRLSTDSFPPSSPASPLDINLSETVIDSIVDRVVRRMSTDVVREVAWEVVPELSEVIIRRTLEERNKRG
jgi:CheY-like chemotaxis protein